MNSQLEKAINLAKTTGDRVIVVDDLKNIGVVVMNLDEYEKLVKAKPDDDMDIRSLTEQELLDKINRDIVIWKSDNKDRDLKGLADDLDEDYLDSLDNSFDDNDDSDKTEDENLYYYDEDEIKSNNDYHFHRSNNKEFFKMAEGDESGRGWNIPNTVKDGAEDIS